MSFMIEGDIPVQIRQALIAESTLNKKTGSFDICLEVANEDGSQSDWWRGNISMDYSRVKNKGHMTNAQVTFERLKELGYQGTDFSQIETLVGVVTTAHCQKSDCGRYMNVKWLGGSSYTPAAVNQNQIQQLNAMLTGGQPQQPAQQPVQQQQPAAPAGFGQPAQQQQPVQQPAQQPAPGGFGTQQQQPAPGGFSN